jgi:para-aminobenzoate synthetase component I
MKPLICFYQDDNYIYSDNYVLHSCRVDQSVNDFLTSIESSFKNELKIVQVNFEYHNQELFNYKLELYPSAPASVFVLNQHEIITSKQVLAKIPSTMTTLNLQFKSLEEQMSFVDKVNQIKKDISNGRLYQVNLSAPFVSESTYTPEKIFKNFFEKFNGQYKALLPLAEYDLISFSPELFLKMQNKKLKTQPIKGSLASESDSTASLLNNPKEEAELSMIVDLLRNDLNRIESENSAQVNFHREIMKLGYIQHTYSEIEIESDKNLPEILLCTMPGGSISGCPKIESLNVINELEVYKRQAYTGTVGWWKDNNFSLNITIRSFMKFKNQLFYHSGCGIVYDSDAEKEWNEFLLKAGSLNLKNV